MAANNITYFLWFKGISFTDMAMLTGWHLLGIGVGGPVFVASARVWGKRHLYLLGTLIIILSSVWAGCSGHSYESMVAARFFQVCSKCGKYKLHMLTVDRASDSLLSKR